MKRLKKLRRILNTKQVRYRTLNGEKTHEQLTYQGYKDGAVREYSADVVKDYLGE